MRFRTRDITIALGNLFENNDQKKYPLIIENLSKLLKSQNLQNKKAVITKNALKLAYLKNKIDFVEIV